MNDRPKGNYSFLIALAKQLGDALQTHRDDDVGNYTESLAHSLGLLLAISGEDAGDGDGGDDEGVDDDDAPGDDTPLGAALRRIAELEGAAATVVQPRRIVGGGTGTAQGQLGAGGQRSEPSVLKRAGSGHSTPLRRGRSKRRGKK